jgi:hypothetical protein
MIAVEETTEEIVNELRTLNHMLRLFADNAAAFAE